MLTLEVNREFVTWPEEFAILMMRYYRSHGVAFVVHRNCIHAERESGEAQGSPAEAAAAADREYSTCCDVHED